MKKKLWLAVLTAVMAVMLTLVGCGTTPSSSSSSGKHPTAAKSAGRPVVLKAVMAFPTNSADNDGFKYFVKEVNEKGKGQVSIDVLGGPEVVPSLQVPNALQSGTIDMANNPMGYEVTLVPEAMLMALDTHTPDQERADGFFDLFNQVMEQKANTVLLPARMEPGIQYRIYTTFPVHSAADFKGKPIRSVAAYNEMLEALGASPVTLSSGDVYSALDRGVVKGFGWSSIGVTDMGWDSKIKYIVNPGFYQSDVEIMLNQNKWNSLTDTQKKILTDAAIAAETAMKTKLKQLVTTEQAKMFKEGVQIAQFPPDKWAKYLKESITAKINKVKPNASPEWITKFDKLIAK